MVATTDLKILAALEMETRGFTQEVIADRLRVEQGTVSKWLSRMASERGLSTKLIVRPPDLTEADNQFIADFYEVDRKGLESRLRRASAARGGVRPRLHVLPCRPTKDERSKRRAIEPYGVEFGRAASSEVRALIGVCDGPCGVSWGSTIEGLVGGLQKGSVHHQLGFTLCPCQASH